MKPLPPLKGYLSRPGLCWQFNYMVGAVITQSIAPPSVITAEEAKRWAVEEETRRYLTFTTNKPDARGFSFTVAG